MQLTQRISSGHCIKSGQFKMIPVCIEQTTGSATASHFVSSQQPERLIIFARFPRSGQVKTRLIPALGADHAARLHQALTHRALQVARDYALQRCCDVEVYFTGGEIEEMSRLFGVDLRYCIQNGDNLGQRLDAAARTAFADGAERVIIIGTDCPDLEPKLIQEANDSLQNADLVLGPARDGGYYLVGMRAHRRELFEGIAWGTETVLHQTLEIASRLNWKVHRLCPLSDIDNPEDLISCRRLAAALPGGLFEERRGVISIVIPTLNEEAQLDGALRHIANIPDIEVIVADGGSKDATIQIAKQYGARVVPVRAGRARQMNAGAAVASGETLLFLHADTRLPSDFRKQVCAALDSGSSAGAFRLRIDDDGFGFRCIEWGANLRSKFLQLPYGDQGLFVRASLFYQLGGFTELALMEDFEMCRRLRRHGDLFQASSAVTTSPRRWLDLGIVRTTVVNQLCVAGYLLGIPSERLARWYSARAGYSPSRLRMPPD
ncbi:MAG: TIGR04283 family arsenosugar biosynthesis glycosyltransferase [Planctomycetaceae bacterium]